MCVGHRECKNPPGKLLVSHTDPKRMAATPQYKFAIYGLDITADRLIPGLVAVRGINNSAQPDLDISFEVLPEWTKEYLSGDIPPWHSGVTTDQESDPSVLIWRSTDGNRFLLQYRDGTCFAWDRAKKQLWATWEEESTLEDTATYLLGPILGFVLRFSGTISLHAGAIAIDDAAILVVGHAGAGKSTTTAAFAKQGYPILSDDVAPLRLSGRSQNFEVLPGYPLVRVWKESAQALYGANQHLPRLTPTWDKLYVDLTDPDYRFHNKALRLGAIYILGPRTDEPDTPRIEKISGQEALLALIGNIYGNIIGDDQVRNSEFSCLGNLATGLPIRRITPHSDILRLPQLVERVISDYKSLQPQPLVASA